MRADASGHKRNAARKLLVDLEWGIGTPVPRRDQAGGALGEPPGNVLRYSPGHNTVPLQTMLRRHSVQALHLRRQTAHHDQEGIWSLGAQLGKCREQEV